MQQGFGAFEPRFLCDLFVIRLISVKVSHSQMVPDTSALTICCGESACAPLRSLKAFHALHLISLGTKLPRDKSDSRKNARESEGVSLRVKIYEDRYANM